MSVLLGLPIPASSIGSLIPELMAELTEDEQLYALHYNGRRLVDALRAQLDPVVLADQEHYIQFDEATRLHEHRLRTADDKDTNAAASGIQFRRIQRLYVSSAQEMSQQLATKFVNYDHLNLAVGLALATGVSNSIT